MRWKTKWHQLLRPFRRRKNHHSTVISAQTFDEAPEENNIGARQFLITTGNYCGGQVFALSKVLGATLSDPKLQQIAMKLLRMGCIDFLLLVGLRYINYQVNHAREEHLKETGGGDWSSLYLALGAVSLITNILAFRKEVKIAIGTAVVILETSDALSRNIRPFDVSPCVQDKCSILRYIKGSFRGVVGYQATAFAIHLVKFMPYAGPQLSSALKIYHDARYALSVTLELHGICNRHQEEYLTQYPELTLAFGLMHFSWVAMTAWLLEMYAGIPRALYQTGLQSFFVIAQINVAAQMQLPRPVVAASRRSFDPIAHSTRLVGGIFDMFIPGLKKFIPSLIKQNGELVAWNEVGEKVLSVWTHPISKKVQRVALPRMLQSPQAFIDDPLIPWESIREKMLSSLQQVKSHLDSWQVQAASSYPKIIARAAQLFGFGIPPACIEFVLKELKNPQLRQGVTKVINQLNDTHRTHSIISAERVVPQHPLQDRRRAIEDDEIQEWEERNESNESNKGNESDENEESTVLSLSARALETKEIEEVRFNPKNLTRSQQNQLFSFFSGIRTSEGPHQRRVGTNPLGDMRQLSALSGLSRGKDLSGNSHKSTMKH